MGKGGKASRQKGDRHEREVVKLLQSYGLAAERVPLSGSAGGSYTGDLTCPVLGIDAQFECKRRKTLPAYLTAPLGINYGAFFREDNGRSFVLLSADTFGLLLQEADNYRTIANADVREVRREFARPRVRHGEGE